MRTRVEGLHPIAGAHDRPEGEQSGRADRDIEQVKHRMLLVPDSSTLGGGALGSHKTRIRISARALTQFDTFAGVD